MTQLQTARKGDITEEMKTVARKEGHDVEFIRDGIAKGQIIIPANINHKNLDPCGLGKGLTTKVNANIGTSSDYDDLKVELEKLSLCVEAKADTVMDLSTGGDISATRRALMQACTLPVGTVPIYQAGIEAIDTRGSVVHMTADDLFAAIEAHARDGVDFMTVHCGVTRSVIDKLRAEGRVVDVVSRGGAFLVGWILHNQQENPLYEQYDRLLELALKYDFTLSLGDGLRPGCLADATDRAQLGELLILGELVQRAWDAGVQVMVEGPGHVPLNQIVANIELQKRICKGAPFYVLGPLVTDVAAGYDHITAAIGGAIAAAAGADYLCYVTPTEHLSLPDPEDVREGIMASRIAAHAADIVKGIKGAWEWDLEMSRARKNLDWSKQIELALDPKKVSEFHDKHKTTGDACSMCGKYCAMEIVAEHLGLAKENYQKC
ncbi:phosphomethylpyrimidine synthase ThiC [Chloroflexota bacterium]